MSEQKINFEIFRRFGPSILKVKIPEDVLNSLNNLIDEILVDKDKQKKLDYGNKLVGDVTQEFQLDEEMVAKSGWLNFLSTCVYKRCG